jgi:hypothetical protein
MSREAETQLEGFIDRFTPEIAAAARGALGRMRARYPGAVQLVYDNYQALVIGFGPNEKPSVAPFSIAIYPRSIALCFLQGATRLEDPAQLLQGSGSVARHIRLESPEAIESREVRALLDQADRLAPLPIPAQGPGKLVIRSISAKQRPRRPA